MSFPNTFPTFARELLAARASLTLIDEIGLALPLPANRVFSPQNWIKTKTCLAGIRAAIQQYFSMLPSMPGGKDLNQKLKAALAMDADQFEARWAAD